MIRKKKHNHRMGWAGALRFTLVHGRLPLRERYWRRPSGGWRLRYQLLGYGVFSALLSFTVLSASSLVSGPLESATARVAWVWSDDAPIASFTVPPSGDSAALDPQRVVAALSTFRDTAGQIRRSAETRAVVAMMQEAQVRRFPASEQRLTIAAGDTLSTLLIQAGISSDEASSAIKAMRKHIRPSDLRPGQVINLERGAGNPAHSLSRLTLSVDPVRTLEVKRGWGGFMTATMTEKPLKNETAATVAVIKGSLYGASAAAGVPSAVTAEAIKALAHQIDFQRDIQPGDRLEIMYDRMVTDEGYVARTGGLIFARLYADGRELTIYRYQMPDGHVDYFDQKGNSIRKALLRTPMDGARLTSGFGMRRHPILGYSKMHKGIDFGASIGTPIYAAGDGVIDKAGRAGAYGNYVRLKHNNTLQTAYAHLSRYGPGIRPGVRVRQGQVIGYVGTTGRSTGPHLHYEILLNGVQVNPQSVKLPTMVTLDRAQMKRFKEHVARLERQFKDKLQGVRYASSDMTDPDELRVQ